MEPSDTEYGGLLGGDPGPSASPSNLEGVLRRHLRRRRRLTAGVASAVLALSLGGGAAIGDVLASSGGAPSAVLAAPRTGAAQIGGPSTSQPATAPDVPAVSPPTGGRAVPSGTALPAPPGLVWGSAVAATPAADGATAGGMSGYAVEPAQPSCASCDVLAQRAHRLFERTTNGVTVRVYALSFGGILPVTGAAAQPRYPVCDPYSSLLVEVSDAGAVGDAWVPDPQSAPRPVDVVDLQVFGETEGSPMAVVVVRAGSAVHDVMATFGSGTSDEMAVVDGVAVLASTVPAGGGTTAQVVAFGAAGQRIERFEVPPAPALAEPRLCFPMLPVGIGRPLGSGVAGGSSGSGGASTGTVSPGATSSSSGPSGSGASSGSSR